MRVMGVDAGESTGAAIVDFPENGPPETVLLAQFKYDNHGATADELDTITAIHRPDVLVAEQFDLRPSNQFVADLSTVYINGALLLLEHRGDIPLITWQTPGQAKGLVKDKVLKNLGFWPTGRTVGQPDANDVRDGLRHVVYYGVEVLKHRPTIKKGWPDAD